MKQPSELDQLAGLTVDFALDAPAEVADAG